jgi:hypothetical protein
LSIRERVHRMICGLNVTETFECADVPGHRAIQ